MEGSQKMRFLRGLGRRCVRSRRSGDHLSLNKDGTIERGDSEPSQPSFARLCGGMGVGFCVSKAGDGSFGTFWLHFPEIAVGHGGAESAGVARASGGFRAVAFEMEAHLFGGGIGLFCWRGLATGGFGDEFSDQCGIHHRSLRGGDAFFGVVVDAPATTGKCMGRRCAFICRGMAAWRGVFGNLHGWRWVDRAFSTDVGAARRAGGFGGFKR